MRLLRISAATGLIAMAAIAACSTFSEEGAVPPTDEAGQPSDGGGGGDGADSTAAVDGPIADAADACAADPPPAVTFENGAVGAQYLTADAFHLYWVSGQEIRRKPFSGAATETYFVAPANITALRLVDDYVVYAHVNEAGATQVIFFRLKSALPGAPSTSDFGDSPSPLTSQGPNVLGYIYDHIVRAQVPTSSFVQIAATPQVSGIAATGSSVYFLAVEVDSGSTTRAVLSVANSQTPNQVPEKVFQSATVDPSEIDVDSVFAYLLDVTNQKVLRITLLGAGGSERTLAEGEDGLASITARGQQVYYATSSGIRSVAKQGDECKRIISTEPLTRFALTSMDAYYVSGTRIMRVAR